jgi:hypothetical protein
MERGGRLLLFVLKGAPEMFLPGSGKDTLFSPDTVRQLGSELAAMGLVSYVPLMLSLTTAATYAYAMENRELRI